MRLPDRHRAFAIRVRAVAYREEGKGRSESLRLARQDEADGLLGPDGSYWTDGWSGLYTGGHGVRFFCVGIPVRRARVHAERISVRLQCDFCTAAARKAVPKPEPASIGHARVYLMMPADPAGEDVPVVIGACRAHRGVLWRRLVRAGLTPVRVEIDADRAHVA